MSSSGPSHKAINSAQVEAAAASPAPNLPAHVTCNSGKTVTPAPGLPESKAGGEKNGDSPIAKRQKVLSDSHGQGVEPTQQHASTPNKDGVAAAASLAVATNRSDIQPKSATTAQHTRPTYSPMTDQKPRPILPEWEAVHKAMSSHELLLSTSPDAWHALLTLSVALSKLHLADEMLSNMEQLAMALIGKASLPGWTGLEFPVGLMMSIVLLSIRKSYTDMYGSKTRRAAGHSQALDRANTALCGFADSLEALGPSQDMFEVLVNCQNLNPGMWEHFEPILRQQVVALGTDQVRPGGLFSAKAWCNIAKVVVMLDTLRGVATPISRASMGSKLKSWHQLIQLMLNTKTPVSDLFQPGLLAGADNPLQLSCVDPETHKQVAFWLIFTKLKKDLLSNHLVFGQALQALITPGMRSDFLIAAWNNCLFDHSLRLNDPTRYAGLVVTLFQGVGLGQPDVAPEAHESAVKLMLRFLDDLKAMWPSWQRDNLEAVFRRMIQLEDCIKILLQEALEQASFALPHALVAALVNCSVQIPRPVTYLAAVFDQYGLFLADVLPKHLQTTQVAHRGEQQALFETACKGLELQQVLPLFAEVVKRTWRPVLHAPAASPSRLAAWMLLMLQWVATYLQRCKMLQHNTMEVGAAAEVFAAHVQQMLPDCAVLSEVMPHMSGSACAERMQGCPKSTAGRGFAVAFFGALAASGKPEQHTAFCRSMAGAWDAAQYQPAPSFKDKIPFFGRKGKPPVAPDDFTCTLCLCLTAFGPGALAQGTSILESCVAVAQNPALFNVYSVAADMIPEHAPELMHTDSAVSGFLTAVSQVLAALSWLDNTGNLSTGSILQLSQLAAALPEMNGCSDVTVAVKLINMRGQLELCRHFLKFLGSDNAVCLVPVAQVANELQDIIAVQEKATGQQLSSVLSRCQGLFESTDQMAFVKHFAMQDSALYSAYLQQRWQLEIDRVMELQGDDEEQDEGAGHLLAEAAPVLAATVAEASAIIGRVLDGAHEDLARLLNEDNLQLRFLEVARQHLAGRDESAELQVVAEYFYPASDPQGEQVATAQRSVRVVTRLNNIRDAIAVTQWADALPHILITIEGYGLISCQDDSFKAMQTLAQGKLALDTLSRLGFREAAGVLESVRQCCGELSGPEKMLFKSVNACNAFWSFIKQEKFYGIEGSRRFDSQVSLVTGQLMSEVYDAGVLADVQQAQRIIATFLTADSFSGLLHNVRELHLDAGPSGVDTGAGILMPAMACLEAVARNMELILNWFSNNSEQKIQTTSLQLEQLLGSGKFLVNLPATVQQQPTLACTYTLADASNHQEQRMSGDGLAEFISKLYLNRHQEHNPADFDEKIDVFLGCYKEVVAIQGVLQQLRMAGHPDHQSTAEDRVYDLARGVQHLEETAASLRRLFASWQDHIQAVHDTYHATLFLSTHQLVVASGLLRTLHVDGGARGQVQAVLQLLMLVPTLGGVSSAALESAVETVQTDHPQEEGHAECLETLGHLMQLLSTSRPIQAALQEPLGQRVVVAPDQAVPLHRILLTLHKEASIQPGQVLWCSQHTHSADLHRFLKCVECHSAHLRFSMIGLESLPIQHREQVLNFQIRVSSEQLPVSIDYLLGSGHEALLCTMSWMPVSRLQEQDLLSPGEAARQVRMQHSVRCFCGPAGSGKSHSMAAIAASQVVTPSVLTIGQNTTAVDVISCLSKAVKEHSTSPRVQFFISSYANFSWVNQLFYQLLVEGIVTDAATGSVFAFLPGVAASIEIEIPNAVPGELQQECVSPFAQMYPTLSGVMYGMILHLPVLADLVGNTSQARTGVDIIDPEQVAIDQRNFGPLVFPLLKLFFTPHPFGGNRCLLDTTPAEADVVARHTGLQLYRDYMFFKLDAVSVTPQEGCQLLGQLQAMVDRIIAESPHHTDRVGPLGSRLRMVNFMHHLHRRAAFFAGGLRDDTYLHFGGILFEIGVRECCQLVNKSLRADWDAYPHSFLLYQEGHIQVVSLQDQMDPFCQAHIIPCGGKLQDALRPYTVGGQQQSVTDRLIFTDAPQHFNTVPLREELLASALLGSSSRQALVHQVLQANNYILTLDYTMKMLHLEERRQSGVPTIMSSETGVGKTKLLTVYHELITACNATRDSRQEALLGLLQAFATDHCDVLVSAEPTGNAVVVAALLQNQPEVPEPSVTDRLKQLREEGGEVSELYSIACQLVSTLDDTNSDTSRHGLNRLLSALIDFIGSQLTGNKLLDHEQLAYILHALEAAGAVDGLMDRATAAGKAYLLDPSGWQATQHDTQACIDELVLDNMDATDAVTPQRSQSVLATLAGLLAVNNLSTFQAMQMHAQVTSADMWAVLKPFISRANACPSYHFTVFVDELNTSSMMGEMKSIFIDKTFEGVKLPPNIFWVAAINPARPESAPQLADGMQKFSSRYAVHPCPASMAEVVWAFGSMSAAQEKDYVTAKLQQVAAQWTGLLDFSEDRCRLLMRYIITAQAFVKQNLEDAAVSQRDLQRAFSLLAFFIQHHNQRRRELPETVPHNTEAVVHRSLLLSLAVAYYFRLSRQLRQDFLVKMAELDSMFVAAADDQLPCYDMAAVVEYELDLFIKAAELPQGIAPNQALRENFFCIAVCVETKIPLIIVGTPGNSKTLSFKLAADRLRGSSSSSKLFRLFHAIDLFHYQCSEQSTSQEIGTVCARALERQTRHTQLQQRSIATVLLDEGGLPGDEKEALKIVHYLWDDAELAYVTISNRPLDAAKSNRAVNVYRSEPSQQDLETLASSFLNVNLAASTSPQQAHCIKACCVAYAELTCNPSLNFGRRSGSSRDLHHFFKYLARHHRHGDRVELSTATVLEALQRNFGGLPASDFRQVVEAFLEHLRRACGPHRFPEPQPGDFTPTLQVLAASLEETGHSYIEQHATLSDKSARPKLVIDYTGDDSAYRLLFSSYHAGSPILDRDRTKIFQMSAFQDDQSSEAQKQMVGEIRRAIECGDTCFLMYTEAIHGSLYDLFNQFFTVQRDRDQNAKLYVQIGIGSYSKPCVVHPEARIVVHTPARLLHTLQAPFLDRFEKYAVSVDSFWELLKAKKDAGSQQLLDEVLAKCQELVSTLGTSTFYGVVPDSTVTTVLLSVLQGNLPDDNQLTASAAVDHQTLVRVLVRAVVTHLLQIMKPHTFLQQSQAGIRLPAAYEGFFNHRQEHYNLKGLFSTILGTSPLPNLAYEDVDSADELNQNRSQPAADEPETSAAGEHRAAAANRLQLLQSTPPQSKWVIFTTTTPDLDMGYVLPAGQDTRELEMLRRLAMLRNYVTDQPEALVVHRLEHLTSKAACLAAVQSSHSDITVEVTVFTANMRHVSQRQVSMLRQMIDDAGSGASDVSKKWVLLLHFMPGAALADSYPALFLYGWNFGYLDSCTGQVSQHEMLHMPSWTATAAAVFHGHTVPTEQLLGDAEMQYGSTTKPYLLTHLRSTVAAQQASQQAHAMLPAKLRPFADFYMSHDVTRRQAALDNVLLHLQEALQLQYNVMWTSEAVSMLVLKAARSVTDGYHRNLSTALADMYQTHAGSFLAGIIYRLCGNNLDLITLMHAQQEWTASRPADNTLLQSMMRFCESRTVAELPALMNQVNVISILGEADHTNFRPAHEFPLFGEVHASMNNIKEDALLSLELAERSLPEVIMAAMEERITSDAAIAGLQACLLLDGSLRLRYAKSVARRWLDVPSAWFSQQLPYGALVENWLMQLWPDGKLTTLHAQLHLHQTQLAAGVMLLRQMTGSEQQQAGHLPATLAEREVSAFILTALWNGLQEAAEQRELHTDDVKSLQQSAQFLNSCNLTSSARRYILLAAHKLLDGVQAGDATNLTDVHAALQALLQCGAQQCSANTAYIEVLQLLPTLNMPQAAAQATMGLMLDLVQRIGKAQNAQPSLKDELMAALHALFVTGLPLGKHAQEYALMELLSAHTLQPANRAKRVGICSVLEKFAEEQAEGLPVLMRMGRADLTYVSGIYGDYRAPNAGAENYFPDALYTAQLRLLLAAKMPLTGPLQDLPSLLADLHQIQLSSTAPPSKQLMDSIAYCAHLHSTIAWLASELSSAEAHEQLQQAVLHSDAAPRLQQQLQTVFAEPTHQRLFVSYLLHHSAGSVSDVLDRAACRLGLGDWTQPWAKAMRPHKEQHAVWQPAMCRTEEYAALQRHFQAFITTHASDDAQEPSDAAVAGAQQWLRTVEEAVTSADAGGKRLLKSSLILMAYYNLFDTHRHSAALAETCPRLAALLDMTPKEEFVLKFLADLSSQQLEHVHADTDLACMFDRTARTLPADSRMQRHFLVNLLAAIMQQPLDSSILCTHLFNPGSVRSSFPLGSVHSQPVGGVHFDCGVQFTADHDMVGAQAPLQDPASAHFVTLLSWGAFSLGHMFFSDVHATTYGPVMSHRGIDPRIAAATDHAWLSTFMMMRVESCWRGLQVKAGLSADLRMLVLNQGLHDLLNTDAAKQADRRAFSSRQECMYLESALRDIFYAAYNSRQEMQTELEALQTASQLRQHFQQWNKELPWAMHVPGTDMAHAQQPSLLDMLPLYIASDNHRSQAHGLLSLYLARRSDWEVLKCIRPALHIYNWAQTALRGLVTMEQTLNSSLHEYIDAFRQKDLAEGLRLERNWADLKLYWNLFHSSRNGFVADDCQPNSAFNVLSDDTCVATFLGVSDEDNELMKVLKALLMLQNDFLERAEEYDLPQPLGSMPMHLLTHTSMDQYLLQSHSPLFDSYLYSQVVSDTAPVGFDLEHLSQQVAQHVASKRFITNTIQGLHRNFCYKQPDQDTVGQQVVHGADSLPTAFAVPLSSQQLSTLRAHCSHLQLEELQQMTSVLHALGQFAAQPDTSQDPQQLLPTQLIKNAAASFAREGAQQSSKEAPQRQTASLFQKHGVQELQLAHLQPVRDFFLEQHHQQGYQFADVSPLLKAPLGAEDTAALKARLAHGCAQDPSNKQALTQLVATLREAELETLPKQASQGATLHLVCEAWAYEADEFPVSVIATTLMCSQYVAVMRVMLQVLREDQASCLVQPKVWAEVDTGKPPNAEQLISPALLRLPIWTDAVSSAVQHPQPSESAQSLDTAISLPQSITWQRMPEPMLLKTVRLRFKEQSASEVLQGMVCGLSISIVPAGHASANTPTASAPVKLLVQPESFVVSDEATLSASVELPVHVDDCVSISTVGEVCGLGDSVYLASWSRRDTSQNFTNSTTATSYILSHGHEAGAACLVELLAQPAADPEEAASPVKHDSQAAMEWLHHFAPQQAEDHEMVPAPELHTASGPDALAAEHLDDQPPPDTAATTDLAMECSPPTALPGVKLPAFAAHVPAGGSVNAVPDGAATCALQMAGFQTKADAVAWLAADGYEKAKTALALLGVSQPWEVALLQSDQVKGLAGIKPITRKKLSIILDKVVSTDDRVQIVFEKYQAWLKEHLEMEAAGDAKLMHRSDMIACLEQSPLSHLARHVLAMAAPEH